MSANHKSGNATFESALARARAIAQLQVDLSAPTAAPRDSGVPPTAAVLTVKEGGFIPLASVGASLLLAREPRRSLVTAVPNFAYNKAVTQALSAYLEVAEMN